MRKKKNLNKEWYKYFSLISQLGLVVVSSILIFFFLFLYLDRKFNTNGILMAVGVFLGVILGVLGAYRLLRKIYRD
ncbi:MAG: AtpZ/AtpI family protein [Candidatus Cloacimonetes bacterium]|nr:AtpZ/AtpI family protein [Candidatus Cloacimonadota bacterium]